jgi:hypothetical protein
LYCIWYAQEIEDEILFVPEKREIERKEMMNSIDIENMNREDADAMNGILRVPTDEQVWQLQRQRLKAKYLSASMTFGQNDKHRNVCTRCGSVGHDAVICPFSVKNLLAPSS